MTDQLEDEDNEINLDEIGWIDEPDGWLLMPETAEEILEFDSLLARAAAQAHEKGAWKRTR